MPYNLIDMINLKIKDLRGPLSETDENVIKELQATMLDEIDCLRVSNESATRTPDGIKVPLENRFHEKYTLTIDSSQDAQQPVYGKITLTSIITKSARPAFDVAYTIDEKTHKYGKCPVRLSFVYKNHLVHYCNGNIEIFTNYGDLPNDPQHDRSTEPSINPSMTISTNRTTSTGTGRDYSYDIYINNEKVNTGTSYIKIPNDILATETTIIIDLCCALVDKHVKIRVPRREKTPYSNI